MSIGILMDTGFRHISLSGLDVDVDNDNPRHDEAQYLTRPLLQRVTAYPLKLSAVKAATNVSRTASLDSSRTFGMWSKSR
jgi:hypothetical protein